MTCCDPHNGIKTAGVSRVNLRNCLTKLVGFTVAGFSAVTAQCERWLSCSICLTVALTAYTIGQHFSLLVWSSKAQWSLYVPPGLTFTNSTFCPHSVFVCFVWIWEQTAIISLYSINWLVFIMETVCVYCAVRTWYLYVILCSAHTVYLCVLCGSENKQRLFPYTTLTDWFFITDTEYVYCAVRTGSLYVILCSAHIVYLCVLCGSENKQQLFPYTALTDWFL